MKLSPVISMTPPQFVERLKGMAAHVRSTLCAYTAQGDPVAESVAKYLEDIAVDSTDPVKIKARAEFLARAEKDPVLRRQVCALRVEQFSNYVLASQQLINFFFEVVNLGPEDRPAVQNNTEQQIRVYYVGQDGGRARQKIIKPQAEELIDLRLLTTDEVNYQLVDIYRGNVVDAALSTIRLAYDMANQREALAFTLLNAAFGSFTFTGANPLTFTAVLNKRIVAGNLPTTNDISVAGNSGSTNFRYAAFQAILDYCARWGNAFIEGPLTPTGRILIPGGDISGIGTEIVPSGATSNPVADQLMTQGWARISYLGRDWTLIADNTLALKACYVELNRKPGRIYLKPSMDKELSDETSYDAVKNNEGKKFMQSVFGGHINSSTRMNVLRVTYRT